MQTNDLRSAASDWVRANCSLVQLQRNFLQEFDRAERKGVHCAIAIGKAMTRSGKPYLVHFHAGEMFIFELTARQAKNLKVRATGMSCVSHGVVRDLDPASRKVVEIKDLVIDGARQFILAAPVTGRCSYSLCARLKGPLMVNLAIEIPSTHTLSSWQLTADKLASEGTLELAFPPVEASARDVIPWRGTTAAFARICAAPDPKNPDERLETLSNVCCVLLDIVG